MICEYCGGTIEEGDDCIKIAEATATNPNKAEANTMGHYVVVCDRLRCRDALDVDIW